MIIENISTGKKYPIKKSDFEKMGKRKSLFTVIDETDEEGPAVQNIENIISDSKKSGNKTRKNNPKK